MLMFSRATTQVILAIISIVLFIGYSANPPNGRTGAPGEGNCNNCHSGGAGFDGGISINGLPADVMAGNTYPLTITVSNPNGLATKAGFQIVALNSSNTNSGTLMNPGINSTIQSSAGRTYHEHNPAQNFPGSNVVNYTVDWTAPSGPNGELISFYGAGNIANGNGNTSGDKIAYVTQSTNLIANSSPPVVDIIIVNEISCNNATDGSLEAVGSEGTPPYSYAWSNGQNGNLATNLGPGTYTVTVTDDAGLSATDMITLTQPSVLTGNHIINNHVSCAGGSDGAATIIGSGGTPGYTYLWSDGNNTAINDMLTAGTYSYTITDANGCIFTSSLDINQPLEISSTIDIIALPSCPGSSDGIVSISSVGGTAPYSYEWSNGGEGTTQTNLSAGLYEVTTTDSNNCKEFVNFELTGPAAIIISVDSIAHIDCFGNMNGFISVSVDGGGTPPFNFSWSNGANTNIISDLSGGTYSVTITDSNNCTVSESYTLTEPDPLVVAAINIMDVFCFSDSTGSATINVNGGTTPYAYTWSNGYEGGQTNNSLPSGSYSVTVTDANNCSDSTSFIINEPEALSLMISSTNESFPGAADGTANANPSGGIEPYMYSWSNGSMSQTLENLTAGNYSVTVTDSNGCTIEESVIINAGDCDLDISEDITHVSCYGGQDGSASVSVSGGLEPYSYLWENGSMDSLITMQNAGIYTLTITDAAACTVSITVSINQPDSLQMMFNLTNPTCPEENSGFIIPVISGGTAPYSFLWSTGDTTDQISNIPAGNYSLSITDVNNCQAEQTIILNYVDDIGPVIELQNIVAHLNESGTTDTLDAEDFIISLSDNCGGPVDLTFSAGMYDCGDLDSLYTISVLATDENGNSTTDSFQVNVVDTIPPNISCMPDVTIPACIPFVYELPEFTDNCITGTLSLISGLGSGSAFPIGETEEVYMVTDQSGNTATCSFIVTGFGDIVTTIVVSDESCREACDGEAIVSILGGTPPYTVVPENLTNLCPGEYIITVTDSLGCTTVDSFSILEAPNFEITNIEVQDASASGDDGFINIDLEGGIDPLSFNWTKDGLAFSMEEDLSGLSPGIYICTITDANGCIIFTEEIIVNMDSANKEVELSKKVKIFPNPASDLIFIEHEFGAFELVHIKLTGMDGKTIIESQNSESENSILNISDVPEGLYVIQFSTIYGQCVKRVLIVR